MKTTITEREYFELAGLLATGQKLYLDAHRLLWMAAETIGMEPEDKSNTAWPYYGHLSDALYSTYTLDETLAKLEIKVLRASAIGGERPFSSAAVAEKLKKENQ